MVFVYEYKWIVSLKLMSTYLLICKYCENKTSWVIH